MAARLFLTLIGAALRHVYCDPSSTALSTLSTSVSAYADDIHQVSEPWHGQAFRDLHREYSNIFRHGNRNAASHLWSKFVLERSEQMSHERLVEIFSGYCAVSGSPVRPSDYTRYRLTLDRVDGKGKTTGFMYYCCWPCVCDTQDFIKVDTRNVSTADGTRTYRFAVLGNPCENSEELTRPFKHPFNHRGGYTTLQQDAPEVRCEGKRLIGAPLSDNGYIIIGMFFDAPGQSAENDWADTLPTPHPQAQPGRVSDVQGTKFQDEAEYGPMCTDRARNGYNSGMGEIFRKVAAITPVIVKEQQTAPALPAPDSACEFGDCKGHTNEL